MEKNEVTVTDIIEYQNPADFVGKPIKSGEMHWCRKAGSVFGALAINVEFKLGDSRLYIFTEDEKAFNDLFSKIDNIQNGDDPRSRNTLFSAGISKTKDEIPVDVGGSSHSFKGCFKLSGRNQDIINAVGVINQFDILPDGLKNWLPYDDRN